MTNTTMPLDDDPIMRNWPAVPATGWTARTTEDLMSVLQQLALRLSSGSDPVASQLLGRVWRLDSPILTKVLDVDDPDAVARRIKISETMNTAGELLGLELGDDLTEKLIPALRRVIADAELVKGLDDMTGYWQNGSDEPVRISQDDATRQYIVTVGRTALPHRNSNSRAYFAGNLRAALRLATDGEKDTVND